MLNSDNSYISSHPSSWSCSCIRTFPCLSFSTVVLLVNPSVRVFVTLSTVLVSPISAADCASAARLFVYSLLFLRELLFASLLLYLYASTAATLLILIPTQRTVFFCPSRFNELPRLLRPSMSSLALRSPAQCHTAHWYLQVDHSDLETCSWVHKVQLRSQNGSS